LIGLKNTVLFFAKKSKIIGSAFFFLGFVFIIIGWQFFTFAGALS